MTNYLEALNLPLPDESSDDRERNAILAATQWAPTPTSSVPYSAANRVLIIGQMETAKSVERQLPENMLGYIACPSGENRESTVSNALHVAGLKISGYLGCFVAIRQTGDEENGEKDGENLAQLFNIQSGYFDQVLDCSAVQCITASIKPPGYFFLGEDIQGQEEVIENTAELIGEFDKPKYFHYNPDICAHSRSEIVGCEKCINACPTDAIISFGETIQVNPHLCQGGGTCASVCPTGAIEYAYPKASEQIELARTLIKSMRSRFSNTAIDLLIFDSEWGVETLNENITRVHSRVLPLMVEEVGSVGLDLLASALAYGANRIFILMPENTPGQVRGTLDSNVEIIRSVLDTTGHDGMKGAFSIDLINNLDRLNKPDEAIEIENVATFAPVGGKRNTIRSALGHFNRISANPLSSTPLPTGSPFGQIRIDEGACTLCMSCVSQCPGKALLAGGDTPALRFIEANCVQCGICEHSCPESIISLEPRLHFKTSDINTARTLKEETPFHCISCGKAFATRGMIKKMTEKLSGHWMFETPEAMNRLRMCEDCRVKDMFDKQDHISI